jgi:hypothetical protein
MIDTGGNLKRARLWTEALPDACFSSDQSFTMTLNSRANTAQLDTEDQKVAVEVVIPLGGRTGYGLLGATFNRGTPGPFVVEVFYSDSNWRRYDTDFCRYLDEVFIGLPKVLAKSVQDAVSKYFEIDGKNVPSGELLFNCAAFGEVGSCQFIFEQLSLAICKVLFSGRKYETHAEVLDLFSATRQLFS